MDSSGNAAASVDIWIRNIEFPDVMKTIADRADQVKKQTEFAAAISGRIGNAATTAKDSDDVAQSLGTIIAPLGEALQAIQSIMSNVTDVPSFLQPLKRMY